MGYAVGGASVMDYQALFQESIQQENLLEKRLDVSFQTAGNTYGLQSRQKHRFQAAPLFSTFPFHPNYLIGLCLFIYFLFFFSLYLSMRAGLRQPQTAKGLFTAALLISGSPA